MAEKQPPAYQGLGPSDQWTNANESNNMLGLREQIKANAGLLFPHGAAGMAHLAYDIAILTSSTDEDSAQSERPQYQAVLTYIGSVTQGMRMGSAAAKGQSRPNPILALESLLHVTAVALEKFQGNVLKEAAAPTEIAGGLIDQSLVHGKSWKSLLGGRK